MNQSTKSDQAKTLIFGVFFFQFEEEEEESEAEVMRPGENNWLRFPRNLMCPGAEPWEAKYNWFPPETAHCVICCILHNDDSKSQQLVNIRALLMHCYHVARSETFWWETCDLKITNENERCWGKIYTYTTMMCTLRSYGTAT